MTYRYHPYQPPRRGGASRTASAVFGVVGGLVVAAVLWLTQGEAPAAIGGGLTLLIGIYGATVAPRGVSIVISLALVGVTAWGAVWTTSQAITVYRALTTTEGPVDPPNQRDLAAATAKTDDAEGDGGFRIEMDEAEITSMLQDGLAEIEDNPLRRVTVDVVGGAAGEPDRIDIVGEFKSGGPDFEGSVTATLVAGAVQIDVTSVELGSLDLPGVGRGAIEDLLADVADLNEVLVGLRADVQSIDVVGDSLVVTGTHPAGALVTSAALLEALGDRAASIANVGEPPAERIGRGEVDGTSAPGNTFYVALGDSLAANVGVTDARDGYVSRVHGELQRREGGELGLRNFGISGETTGTLIRSGQLETAVAFLRTNGARYVTIDIGANDLLGHLGSDDCADDIDASPCRSRIEGTFATYAANIEVIFDTLAAAAPNATIVFVTAYNPFSLGLADTISFERRSDAILAEFNAIASSLAVDRSILVADAFSPMMGTTGVTTHMLDAVPDIHPVAIGFDVLAASVIDALDGR